MGDKTLSFHDASALEVEMLEVERKYRLTSGQDEVNLAISRFLSRVGRLFEEEAIVIDKFVTFVGIDQYFIVQKGENEFIFRYRMGANRLPELTVKFQITAGSNLVRGEINLNVRYEDPKKIRAFMSVVCRLGDSYEIFSVQQSGNIWIIKEPDENLIEVVVYKTDRIFPSHKVEGFVEIEPLTFKNIEQAVARVGKYEEVLNLGGFVCLDLILGINGGKVDELYDLSKLTGQERIAEMFRSQKSAMA